MIHYEKDQDGIVTLTIDAPGQAVNTMNLAFQTALQASLLRLEQDQFSGVILTSATDSFFAGGDLRELIQISVAADCYAMVERNKALLRRLETLQKPIVAAINGSALGGGLELALACHYRIAIDHPKTRIGFPEVTLGLLPGAGGVARTVRLLGLQRALPILTEGTQLKPQAALQAGLLHALAIDKDDLLQQARVWIAANPNPAQVWDIKHYNMPGGAVSASQLQAMIIVAPAMLREKTRGNYPAPEAILCAMVEGAQVDFENACKIESRYFTQLACGQVAKNMISTLFFQMQEIQSGKNRPQAIEKWKVSKLGILGAGMMGTGIAAVSAARGMQVILQDVNPAQADKARQTISTRLERDVSKNKITAAAAHEQLARIQATGDAHVLQDCDLIIEAVYENRALKAKVTREAEAFLQTEGILASNTSTLPITGLAQACARPEKFIGLHFFSPVEKMQLVEIIKGKLTSARTLAQAYDYVLQIGKLPIVVNDARGFFTSRVFASFVNEGVAMLAEGHSAIRIENAALAFGMPVGPLAVQDEVALTLSLHVHHQMQSDMEAEEQHYTPHPALRIIQTMVEQHQRNGRAGGAGFYEYPADGKKYLWPMLKTLWEKPEASIAYADMQDRMLYIQVLESLRCLQEGVLESARDANIGSIFGFGFPAWTGGVIQFIHHTGIQQFIQRAQELHACYGERFAISPQLQDKILSGLRV